MMPLPGVGDVLQSGAALKGHCPRCRVPLKEETYEGTSLLKCSACEGVFVTEADVLQIVHTRDKKFDGHIVEMGQLIRRQGKPLKQNPFDTVFDEKSIVCPACLDENNRMHRRFVSPQFPVEVDKCRSCKGVWFDKDELEVLQYLYESDHPVGV
jgi:Zn-finger nucleic acid-binding protein